MNDTLAEIKQDRVHVVADAWLTPAEAAEFALSVAALANQLSADRAGDAAALAAICADPVDVSMGLAARAALAAADAEQWCGTSRQGYGYSCRRPVGHARDFHEFTSPTSGVRTRWDIEPADVSTALAAHTAATLDAIGDASRPYLSDHPELSGDPS